MKTAVFVSGPYSNNIEENLNNVIEVSNKLIDMGFVPVIPHFYHYIEVKHEKPYDVWLNCALGLLERSDIYFRLPGESPGADKEEAFADELDMVKYYSIDDLLQDTELFKEE